jgi:hypothetical protein
MVTGRIPLKGDTGNRTDQKVRSDDGGRKTQEPSMVITEETTEGLRNDGAYVRTTLFSDGGALMDVWDDPDPSTPGDYTVRGRWEARSDGDYVIDEDGKEIAVINAR